MVSRNLRWVHAGQRHVAFDEHGGDTFDEDEIGDSVLMGLSPFLGRGGLKQTRTSLAAVLDRLGSRREDLAAVRQGDTRRR
jgi:hypothetical protein